MEANDLNDIYTELVMEHSANSPYKHDLESANCSLHGHNPNCGDDITLKLEFKDDKIADASFVGQGCAISQSSTSIMIDTLRGKTLTEAKNIIAIFLKMIRRESLTNEEKDLLKDSIAFENISNMPARVKCVELAWRTLDDMLNKKNI